MYQGKDLNLSRIPQTRGQIVPAPTVAANGTQVIDHEDRIVALEAAVAALQADVITLQSDVADLQATVADHETRIAALEP
jgi:hypothetical protein